MDQLNAETSFQLLSTGGSAMQRDFHQSRMWLRRRQNEIFIEPCDFTVEIGDDDHDLRPWANWISHILHVSD